MKTLIKRTRFAIYILLTAGFLTSCGYYKENEPARVNHATGELQYVVWVWHNGKVIKSYRVLTEDATCEKVDSLNMEADKLIKHIEELKACR